MGAGNYFALTELPVLDPPPAEPPLALTDLVGRAPRGRPEALVRCIVLADDLLQREATLAGELPRPEPAVLDEDQVAGDSPLPRALAPDPERDFVPGRLPADAIWNRYYRYAADQGRRLGSRFLTRWVAWEVTTRNALAVARARALGVDPERFLLATDLTHDSGSAEALATAWASAAHPLDGFRGLLAARWRWAQRQEPWFTFSDDEFAAYAAKLLLLHRWLRASEFGPRRHAEGTGEVQK